MSEEPHDGRSLGCARRGALRAQPRLGSAWPARAGDRLHRRRRGTRALRRRDGAALRRREPVEPFLQARGGARRERRCPPLRLLTQRRDADIWRRADLAGMADIPALELTRLDLDMTLEGEAVPLPGEGLLSVARRRSEMDGALRQIEGIAMPVQHRRVAERCQAGGAASLAQKQRRPADLLAAAGIDAGAQGACHHLGTETDAEHGSPRGEAFADRVELVGDEGIDLLFIGADRPAEDDQEIGRRDVRGLEIIDRRLAIGDGPAAALQHRGKAAEILEGDMADGDGLGHGGYSTVSMPATRGWRTMSRSVSRTMAISATDSRRRATSARPDKPSKRSLWSGSPVKTIVECHPRRVNSILI